jgi:hypothetical protein
VLDVHGHVSPPFGGLGAWLTFTLGSNAPLGDLSTERGRTIAARYGLSKHEMSTSVADHVAALDAHRKVDRPSDPRRKWQRGDLAALAHDCEGAVASLEPEGFDVGADRLRHPQSVQRQQRHQGVVAGRGEPGGDQEGAELVAIQMGHVGLVVDPRAADVHRRGWSITPSSSA